MLNSFKIGHYTDLDNGTGCTVIIPPDGNICSAYAMGASPGSREYALLQPDKKLQSINALLLTGGSAFGLNAAMGIIDELEKNNIGYKTSFGVVPIVPGAVVFDLNIGNGDIRPGPEEGKKAYNNATFNNTESGNVGAGTGTTVGKWSGLNSAMKGGLGVYQVEHGDLKVCALVVVNSVGDIINTDASILAGAYTDHFLAAKKENIRWGEPIVGMAENTVLCAVMTNARISKQQASYLSKHVHLGIAKPISPSHTSYDGDIAFVLAQPEVESPIDTIASMTISAIEMAIITAVKKASKLFKIISLNDI